MCGAHLWLSFAQFHIMNIVAIEVPINHFGDLGILGVVEL